MNQHIYTTIHSRLACKPTLPTNWVTILLVKYHQDTMRSAFFLVRHPFFMGFPAKSDVLSQVVLGL